MRVLAVSRNLQVNDFLTITVNTYTLELILSCIEAHREGESARRRMEATLIALESGMAHLTHALKIEIQV